MKKKGNLSKAIKYANKLGYEVNFKANIIDYVDFEKKVIKITTRQKEREQVYCILHELGHVVLSKNKRSYKKKYQYHTFHKRSKKYLITEIEEEIHAWKVGEEIAKKIGIKIDRKAYNECSNSSIMTYIDYASKNKKKYSKL